MAQTIAQKVLYFILLALIMLMVIFSFKARENIGKRGFDGCIQKKCEISQEYCSKFREVNNCCQGAGGQTTSSGECVFV